MKSLRDMLNESLISEAEGLQAIGSVTSHSSNPPLEIDGIDRYDFNTPSFLGELLDEEGNLDEKKTTKYKEFLKKNADLIDGLFVMYVDNRFRRRTTVSLVLSRHKDGENETYYVMTPQQGVVDTLEWLTSNLFDCISFARRYTIYRG